MPARTDREEIEHLCGPLWSGREELTVGDRAFTLRGLKRILDLTDTDIIGIDLVPLPGDTFAYRFYDGDDRRIAVFVLDRELNLLREIRAHIADWIEDEYHEAGMEAFFAASIVRILRRKVLGEDFPPEEGS